MFYHTSLLIILVVFTTSCSDPATPPKTPPKGSSVAVDSSDVNQIEEPSFLEREVGESGIDYEKKYTNSPPENEKIIKFGTYQITKPSSWFWIPPSSTFVLSNYVLPGIQGEESGMFTISEFQSGEGGNFDTNVIRWKSHFRTFGGAPIKPVISNIEVHGNKIQTVHIRGEYMGAGAAWHKPNHTLLVVLIENDTHRYFLKMLGATETISAHRDSFYDAIQFLEIVPES